MLKLRIQRIDDIDEARDLHALAFTGDKWPGDDHTFWAAFYVGKDDDGKHHAPRLAGFCSAVMRPEKAYCFLSRAAVVARYQGFGVQRAMIKARLRWAKREGAPTVVTYTDLHAYPSIINLLRCGFKFTTAAACKFDVGKNWHYFLKLL